jgi:hypothetical protein
MTFDRPKCAELKTFLTRRLLPKLLFAALGEDLHRRCGPQRLPPYWLLHATLNRIAKPLRSQDVLMGMNLALPAGVGRRHKDCYILDRQSAIHAEPHRHLKSAGLQTCPGRDEAGAKFRLSCPASARQT